MTVNPQRINRLTEHGLTTYEARAYLALLDLGDAEASQVAEVSRVPRTKIYKALDGLEEKRLVEVVPDRPKRFLVQPIERYLAKLEEDHRRKARELDAKKTELGAEFAPDARMEPREAGGFLAIQGRSNALSRTLELVDKARETLTFLTSGPGAKRLAYHADRLQEAHARGVEVRVLCPSTATNREARETLAEVATVREARVDPGPSTLAVADHDEAIISHHVPDDTHHYQGADPAVWTDDGGIVEALLALAASAWTLAHGEALDTAAKPLRVNGDLDLREALARAQA